MRHFQSRPIIQETTFQLPSPSDLLLMSYPNQPIPPPRRYRPNDSSSIVPLPPLMTTTRAIETRLHDIKLNLYGY